MKFLKAEALAKEPIGTIFYEVDGEPELRVRTGKTYFAEDGKQGFLGVAYLEPSPNPDGSFDFPTIYDDDIPTDYGEDQFFQVLEKEEVGKLIRFLQDCYDKIAR